LSLLSWRATAGITSSAAFTVAFTLSENVLIQTGKY
jgi:hypothetical protein